MYARPVRSRYAASARFVAEATRAPGSVLLAVMEGSRPLLVEVQALVAPSELEQPRRVVSGFDRNRLALVLAILARHGRVGTGASDVFVNVVGGVRVEEPGCDLAVALAVASASRGVPTNCCAGGGAPRKCFGELGLTGELRWVGHPERRLPGNLNLSFAGVDGEALMMAMRHVAVSSGSACSSANPEPSHVLMAMGLDEDMTRASLRFGLGRFTTKEEIDLAASAVTEAVTRLRRHNVAWTVRDDA